MYNKQHHNDLQTLRGIAILAVLLMHLSLPSTILTSFGLHNSGWLGVEMFFLLSGFLITKSLHGSSFHLKTFIIRRVFRLFPTILITTVIIWLTKRLLFRYAPNVFISELFFSKDFDKETIGVILGIFNLRDKASYMFGQMWSLSIEFQFYNTLIVCIFMVSLFSKKHIKYLFFVIALVLYILIFLQRISTLFDHALFTSKFIVYLYIWRFDCLAVGVLLFYIPKKITNQISLYCSQYSMVLLLFPFVVALFFELESKYTKSISIIASQICFSLLVIAAIHNKFSMKNRWLYLFGDLSYSMYLIHFTVMVYVWFFIYFALPSICHTNPYLYGSVQLVLTISSLVLLSKIIYRYIEKPFISIGRNLDNKFIASTELNKQRTCKITS